MCSGWWFIVIRQKRWSSYSVIVLPGQCLYVAPTSNSSKYRPNCTLAPHLEAGRRVRLRGAQCVDDRADRRMVARGAADVREQNTVAGCEHHDRTLLEGMPLDAGLTSAAAQRADSGAPRSRSDGAEDAAPRADGAIGAQLGIG